MNNEGLPSKMDGWLKDVGFLFSGLRKGCSGLTGTEMSRGDSAGGGNPEEGLSPPVSSASPCSEPRICLLSLEFVRKYDWACRKILCVPCLLTASWLL